MFLRNLCKYLHGVTFQTTVIFIVTALRTSCYRRILIVILSGIACCINYSVLQFLKCHCQDSSVGIATGYGLDGRGSILGRGKIISPFHSLDRLWVHPWGTGGSFAWGKASWT
jgi:hypothetical protein